MPDPSLDRTLFVALPWLAAFVVAAAAHVSVVQSLDEQPAPRAAPIVDVDIEITQTRAAPVPAAPTAPKATVFTVDPACTGGPEPQLAPELLFGVRQRGPTQFEIDRHVVDVLVELGTDPQQVRAVPAIREGRRIGTKLYGLQRCSPLSLLGLQNGDLLVRVDGKALAEAQPSVVPYARLARAKTLTVDILRHGEPLSLNYVIR